MTKPSRTEMLNRCIVSGVSVASLLTELQGIDLDEVGENGRTPLMAASSAGLIAVVDLLVKEGASVGVAGHRGLTALHEACANDHAMVAQRLIFLGADVDAETADGVTPLMCAAAWGAVDAARLLLENHADPSRIDHAGATAADIAREKGEDQTAALIDSFTEKTRTG